jgi:hypothetical protein
MENSMSSLANVNIRGGFYSEQGNAYTGISGDMPRLNSIRRVVNRDGFRALARLFDALIGANAGGTASGTFARVGNFDSNTIGNNESRIVTQTVINRATTSADVTELKSHTVNVTVRPPFPADRSGNGGPALA